ncbi:MAG: NAD-binding protein [Anaerolineales bacterium]|nr:MAG: NAD-binding protein [Anaerolineales bacterium]
MSLLPEPIQAWIERRRLRPQGRHRTGTDISRPLHLARRYNRTQRLRRYLRAQLRDARVLFQESRNSLIAFVGIVLGGALIFHFFYTYPGTQAHPRLGEALHATFALIFFETLLPFPEVWYLQALFFIIPIMGLAVVADGVLRFGAALLNKQARGQKWQVAMASTYSNHVIVCGMGKVGYRVTLELLKFGREVVGIEQNPEGRFVEKARGLGIPLIIANARRSENLIKAGVKRADAVIPCTDDELTNLDIALDARELNPQARVVMRLFDADLARRVEKGFGIHTAFSTSALAAPIFAAAAMRANVKYSFYVGDTLLSLSQLTLGPDSALIGWPVHRLESELDLSVVCYQGQGQTDFHPPPDLRLAAGDQILVLASLETLQQVNGLNRDG